MFADLKKLTISKLNEISPKRIKGFSVADNPAKFSQDLIILFEDDTKRVVDIYPTNNPLDQLRSVYNKIKEALFEDLPYMDRKIRELAI